MPWGPVAQWIRRNPLTLDLPERAERVEAVILYNAEHHGKTDGTDRGAGLRKEKRITCTPKPRIQSRKNHLGKRSQVCIGCLRRIPEEGANTGRSSRSERCVLQSAIQTADGTRAITRQLDAHKMAGSSTPGKKGCHATWNLTMGFPQAPPPPPPPLAPLPVLSPLQCLHKRTGGSEQQKFKPGAYSCGRRAYLQNSQWHPHSSHRCPGTARISVTLVPRGRVRNQFQQGANPVVHPQQQSSRTSNVSSLLQRRSQNVRTVSDTSGSTSTECWRTICRSNQQSAGARKYCPRWKP